MPVQDLLSHDAVRDVITTPDALYIITDDKEALPPIYTDKAVHALTPDEILTHLPALLQGESALHGQLQKRTALAPGHLYEYALTNLTQSQKQSFSHALYGTGGRDSLLEAADGRRVGRGAFIIPAGNEAPIEEYLEDKDVAYEKTRVLTEEKP